MAISRIFTHPKNKLFAQKIFLITGLRPKRISIFKEAFKHSSVNDNEKENPKGILIPHNNERLEFLGDAILDAVIAEYLFLRFPAKQEGFLTEMRMRIVNRDQMAMMAERLGLMQMLEIKSSVLKNNVASKTVISNALESLIGAVYLDFGYKTCRKFIIQRLLDQYLDIDKLMNTTISHKAVFLKWCQQMKHIVRWEYASEFNKKQVLHTIQLYLNENLLFTETNNSRRKGEELCCEKACRKFGVFS